jgi:hypothetical protein
LNHWTVLGATAEVSPGYSRFSDSQTPDIPQCFCRARSINQDGKTGNAYLFGLSRAFRLLFEPILVKSNFHRRLNPFRKLILVKGASTVSLADWVFSPIQFGEPKFHLCLTPV